MKAADRFTTVPGDLDWDDPELASLAEQLVELAFDPAEPRDPEGKWVTLFHGTTQEAARSIQKTGLTSGDYSVAENGMPISPNLVADRQEALRAAHDFHVPPDKRAAVVEVRIPRELENEYLHPAWGHMGYIALRKPLPPSMVHSVQAEEQSPMEAFSARQLDNSEQYLSGQLIELASGTAWLHELRDSRGRWTRGTPGPFNQAVWHLYQLLPQVNQAHALGLFDAPTILHSQAQVHIIKLPGGENVIDKRGEDPTDLDREELASYVAQAIGAPAPAVYRAAPDRALQEFVPGQVALRYFTGIDGTAARKAEDRGMDRMSAVEAGVEAEEDARDAIHATPEARAIADLDYLITNDDRNDGNWMVTPEGRPVAIDHGVAMFDGMPSDSEFVGNNNPMMRGHPGTDSPDDPAAVAFRQQRAAHGWELADQLHQVRRQFERTGHLDWFTNIIETPVAQLINPADPRQAEQQILAHWHDKYGDPG